MKAAKYYINNTDIDFDTDFGNKSYRLQAYNENKKPIKMNNAGDLYDFLKNA